MPGIQELLVILLIIVVLFGATKLPALGKGLGQGIRNFKKGLGEAASQQDEDAGEEPNNG